MTCRKINVDEYKQFLPQIQAGTIKSFPKETDCNNECGVCCANICDSCSWVQNISIYLDSKGNTSPSNTWESEVGGWYYKREFLFNGFIMFTINSNSSGNLYWINGYPGLLSGTLYVWTLERHNYMERVGDYGFYKEAIKEKYTLYQCQNGAAIDITDQAVHQEKRYEFCEDFDRDFNRILYGQVELGTVLDWTRTIIPYSGSIQNLCQSGAIKGSWDVTTTPYIDTKPSQLLSCTQRECREISKTFCDAGNGTWQPGLTCPEVNCT